MSASTPSASQMQARVAVVGAGPAGLYATQVLAARGAHVALFNRDIKPGGLAEYGIFPTKHKMKDGLRKQFRQILASPHVEYFGNVTVGRKGDLRLDELRGLGCDAVLVTVGAQGTKWLGLPGEDLTGVHHAKDLVYHYNRLPPFAARTYAIGRRVAIVGVGNVMLDIAHWLVRHLHVDEVVAVARRGPAEVKFDKGEMEYVARNLDVAALDVEIERVRPAMEALGQDVAAARAFILAAMAKAPEPNSATRFRLEFLASPVRIVGEAGRVIGLQVEDTMLVQGSNDVQAHGTGCRRVIPCDSVVFAVGDSVDPDLGLALRRNAFAVHPEPRYPIEGVSYEALDPDTSAPLDNVFVAGWARSPSMGLVGMARKDGNQGAFALVQALATRPVQDAGKGWAELHARLERTGKPVVGTAQWNELERLEHAEAERLGRDEFKFATNDEMLAALNLNTRESR